MHYIKLWCYNNYAIKITNISQTIIFTSSLAILNTTSTTTGVAIGIKEDGCPCFKDRLICLISWEKGLL